MCSISCYDVANISTFSEPVGDSGLLFAPGDTGIARICPGGVHFSMLPQVAVRGAPKVDPKF